MFLPLLALLQIAGGAVSTHDGTLGTPVGAPGSPLRVQSPRAESQRAEFPGAISARARGPRAVSVPDIYRGTLGQLDVTVPKLGADLEVDGVLDEAAWADAAVLTGFSQYKPVDGLPADDNTEVLVWYSSEAIHFGIRAFEPHGIPNASLADRDKIATDDHVQILLDTFNDSRSAVVFGVNPLGVQSDGSRIEQAVSTRTTSTPRDPVDLSQDFLFESKGRLTEWGYEIEVLIPFKSLSYQSEDTQSWGINIIRRVQHSGHEQTWTPALLGRASFLAQSGTLHDLTGFDRGLVLDINPVVTRAIDGASHTAGWEYDAQQPEFGGNIRWGLTSNLTLDGTVNPDFSQVEADEERTQYDPRRAVFFAEKRPFFLEGSEYLQAPNRLIYTRRISSPVAATKFTGKIGGTELAVLSAADDKALSVTGGDYPIYNLVRIKRDVGDESTVGIAYTDRVDGSDYNRVASADTRFVFGGIYDLRMQGAMSFDRVDGTVTDGHLWDLSLARRGRQFGWDILFKGLDDELVARSGFLSRVGTVQLRGGTGLTGYGRPGAKVERYSGRVSLDANWRHETFLAGEGVDDLWRGVVIGDLTLRGGWALQSSIYFEKTYFPADLFTDYAIETSTATGTDTIPFVAPPAIRGSQLGFRMTLPSSQHFSGSISGFLGDDVNWEEWTSGHLVILRSTLVWRPTDQLRMEGSFERRQNLRKVDMSTVRIRDIPRLKIEYQLTRAIFFRFVGQYDATNVDDLRDDTRTEDPILVRNSDGIYEPALAWASNDFRVDGLFSFEPSPGTVILAGYGSSLTEEDSFRFQRLERTNDGFFVKLSYLLRM